MDEYVVMNKSDLVSMADTMREALGTSDSIAVTDLGAKLAESIEADVQSDWNQNDETQPDYIKNRPFYTGDTVETVLVEESTIPFEDRGNGIYMAMPNLTFSPIVGDTYKVTWDGTVYESVCAKFSETYMIGNLSLMEVGSDTGEPFLMLIENGQFVIGTTDTASSHTISISGLVTEVVKIDPKYIRDMYYTAESVEAVLVEESIVPFKYDKRRGFYIGQFETTFSPIVGETYKVYWDGTIYERACVEFNRTPVIGNLSITGDGSDTGEPFAIGQFNVGQIDIVTQNTSASHTISISGRTTQVVKIDEKYLPDTVATKSDVEVAQTAANNAQTTANAAKTAAENAQTAAANALSTASAKFQLMQQNTVTTTTTIGTINNRVGSVPVKGLNIAVGSTIKFTADNNVSGETVWDRPVKKITMKNNAGVTLCVLRLELSHDGETYNFINETISSTLSNLVIEYEKVIIPKVTYPTRNEGAWLPPYLIANCLYLTKQSTSSSSATLYRITVNNSGTLTATEVT